MKNRNKIDPRVQKVMNQVGKKQARPVHVAIMSYDSVLCYAKVTPKNFNEEQRIKHNRSNDEEARPSAFRGTIQNSDEGAYMELSLDGKELCYSLERGASVNTRNGKRYHSYTNKNLDWAWLCINGRRIEKIYSDEGLKKLIG